MGPRANRLRRESNKDEKGRPVIAGDFTNSTFLTDVDFSGFVFHGACFDGATFKGEASFRDADFEESASFQGTTFEKAASFEGAEFRCSARFACDSHDQHAAARRQETIFTGWADFRNVSFYKGADFGGARFESRARFGGATFGTANEPARGSFDGARFAYARSFGPMLGWGTISLDRAIFESNVRIGISASTVTCRRTIFLSRTTLEIRNARVWLEDAEFGLPSVVAGSKDLLTEYDTREPLDDAELEQEVKSTFPAVEGDKVQVWRPLVCSLQRANVGNLTLSEVDLTVCRFDGAHNLDGVRFEGVDFPLVVNLWGVGRRAVYEERKMPKGEPGKAEGIARTYRALRKGREDNKDEPGAADFYYGEMEMRRKARRGFRETGSAKRTSWTEWLVLWAYKLVSGYGLRASRSLIFLAITIVGGALLLKSGGFKSPQSFGDSVLFSLESAASFFRGPTIIPGSQLDPSGHAIQIGLRLLGPLFFGLALLALRGRVKR
jgi:uncharacterized protein YjbI with pentapeptide repeats